MNVSSATICNLALSRIGVDKTINALDTDESKEAVVCRLHYPICRAAMFEEFPWNFARKRVALGALAEDPPADWAYAYAYPSDCARAVLVIPSTGSRYSYGSTWGEWLGGAWVWPLAPYRIPWIIEAGASGKRILTDEPNAWLMYVALFEDESQYPAQFIEALSMRVAHAICMPMRIDDTRRGLIMKDYTAMVSSAQAKSLNEQVEDAKPLPEALRVRM